MASDTDTDQAAAWYLAATPGAMSQWLVRLWRTTAALDLLVIVAAFLLAPGTFPLRRLAPLLAAAAFIDVERASRRAGARATSRAMTAIHLLLQVALLTGLLELSGGPSNPFSVIYAVQVALAAVTLGAGWASVVAGWTALCYGLLISWHLEELVPAHHRLIDFPTHLFTMWLALAALIELAAHFVGAASRAVARREAELASMREQAARIERLVSLTTLAAGAAHELSTPLATIAIASKELERALSGASVPFDATKGGDAVTLEVNAQGGLFRFVVQDQGQGMSQDTLRRAGEPFYTTKDAGQWLGLGVFLARAFAERRGGSLSMRLDHGTTAVLTLPAGTAGIDVVS